MPTDIETLHELVELKQGHITTYQGTPLATGTPEGVDLGAWLVTFSDDFTDIASTITDDDGTGPWFAPGTYTTDGKATFASVSRPAEPIYTQEGDYLGLGMRREAGFGYWGSCINTATFSDVDLNHEPKIGFAQQYGYFECRFKAVDPTGSNANLWPGFFVNELAWLGGSTGNVGVKRIELDIIEMYNGDPNSTVSKDQGNHHHSVHTHEPLRFVAPGVWGRNVGGSNITSLVNNPIWGTGPDFQFWQDFHTYGLLVSPEWIIFYFDRLELMRFPMLQEFHNKYYLLLTHQLNIVGPGDMPDGVQFKILVDYVRVWQNPNWQTTNGPFLERGALAGGGGANNKTFSTGTPMTSYAAGDGRTFAITTRTANTGPATANANGLGALPIYKSTASGTVPLARGDIPADSWLGLRLDMSLGGGNGGWLLLTPGYSAKPPSQYVPPVEHKPSRVIQVEDVEAGLAEKHGIPGSLFPAGHPATSPKVANSAVTPRMPVSLQHTIGTNVRAGDSVVAATVANTPDRPVRYALTDLDGTPNPYFDVHPATGEIFVRENVSAVPAGGYDLALSAWPTPPQAVVPGSNATRIHITVSGDSS